ncbi:MAG: hypothetical protein KA248_05475 [Kiritimatiellae bacterium]|nr:hypothetical protein [Kiritimatiellia bacterium]
MTAAPPEAARLTLLGVDYLHVKTADGGDLYLTPHGVPFREHLRPENWYDTSWFEQNREKLIGTGTVYRVRTRPQRGFSKELVVKWCRVGEEVPMDTFTLSKFVEAEFNSPYEEFSLVMEMRARTAQGIVRTHKPLGIYVPAKKLKLWQTGRSLSRMEQKKAKNRDVELDVFRQYILIYEWIKGVSASEAFDRLLPDPRERRQELIAFTDRVAEDLHRKGFRVLDSKPEHFIVRPRPEGGILRSRDGTIPYALVDFELLERTPEREQEVTASRRAAYLQHQKDRFAGSGDKDFPTHLTPSRVFGVDYVYGHSESTQGQLWVVGRDPSLFDYFLPERWRRTPRRALSKTGQTHYTRTKDLIHLVWKVSRVGERPDPEASSEARVRIAEHGYNSPFEEFAMALELGRRGVATVYPRAIYMTGQEAAPEAYTLDPSRYVSHQGLRTPEGFPVLRTDHNYITVWGFWNGSDELLASRDTEHCRGMDLLRALEDGLIDAEEFAELLDRARAELTRAGFEDLNLKGTHVMLSLTAQDHLIRQEDGQLALRFSNFSFMRKKP